MGYYLSKKDKGVLDLFIPTLRKNEQDFEIAIKNADRLLNILINSRRYDEYKWICEKFRLEKTVNGIKFRLYQLNLDTITIVEHEDTVHSEVGFFEVINRLLGSNTNNITFMHTNITEDELDKIQIWANQNGFELIYNNPTLRIKKNE